MPVALTPGLVLGPYTLEAKIALGGMAEIWSAKQRVDGHVRQVGLKILQPFFSSEATFHAMFQDEVNIAQRLKHQNIVQVYSGHEIDGHLLQAMELLDGIDIRRMLIHLSSVGEWFPAPLAVMVAREIARGLFYAHNRKNDDGVPLSIIHRDISPHNIMVTRDGSVKILDFGIARAAERLTRTRTGVVKGKLAYMAPEQALAAELTPRTDIFSLGIVLWEMLAMQRLFKANSDAAVLELVIKADVPPIRSVNDVVTAEVEDVLNQMLAKNPKDRPDNMRSVENLLTRALTKGYPTADYDATAFRAWLHANLDGPLPAPGSRRPGKTQVLPPPDETIPDLGAPAATPSESTGAVAADTVVDHLPGEDDDKTVPGGMAAVRVDDLKID